MRDAQQEKKVLFEARLVRKHLRLLTEHMDHLEVAMANAFDDDEPYDAGAPAGDERPNYSGMPDE